MISDLTDLGLVIKLSCSFHPDKIKVNEPDLIINDHTFWDRFWHYIESWVILVIVTLCFMLKTLPKQCKINI